MTGDGWPCELCTFMCVFLDIRACFLFIGSHLCYMCFRGNFSGGASAKDKGHWSHWEWFLCSSGFQIIQGWYKGAFCLSFVAWSSLSPSFHSVSYWIFLSTLLGRLSRDGPDQIKHSHSVQFVQTEIVSSDTLLFAAPKVAAPTQKPQQATVIPPLLVQM